MHLDSEHLNYVKWRCDRCDRTEIRWKGADPEVVHKEVMEAHLEEEAFRCYLGDEIDAVVNEETEGILPLAQT